MQQCIDLGLNAFAFQLLAESFADDSDKFGGENVVLYQEAHDRKPVFFILTKEMPTARDFDAGNPDTLRLNKLEAYILSTFEKGREVRIDGLSKSQDIRKMIDEMGE